MIKVIKRDGTTENYNKSKLIRSIANSADDVKIALNKRDLDIICMDVEKKINDIRSDGSPTSTYEIRAVIVDMLTKLGFRAVANSYYRDRMNQ